MKNTQTQHTRYDLDQDRETADYLRGNPDFFNRHLELLGTLTLPHVSGGAVSLVERQISVLREQNRDLKDKLLELVHVARDNDRLTERMHSLTLGLIETDTLESTAQMLTEILRNEFQADFVALGLFEDILPAGSDAPIVPLQKDGLGIDAFAGLLKTRRPQCGSLKDTQGALLFGDRAEEIRSAAVMALGRSDAFGLLAIGSHEPRRFHPGLGKVFLNHLGELATAALARYIA